MEVYKEGQGTKISDTKIRVYVNVMDSEPDTLRVRGVLVEDDGTEHTVSLLLMDRTGDNIADYVNARKTMTASMIAKFHKPRY